jgi:hypothetical protein
VRAFGQRLRHLILLTWRSVVPDGIFSIPAMTEAWNRDECFDVDQIELVIHRDRQALLV